MKASNIGRVENFTNESEISTYVIKVSYNAG